MSALYWITIAAFYIIISLNYDNSITADFTFAQTPPADGGVHEMITKDWMQFYLSDINIKTGTTEKEIEISFVIKNLDDKPQKFGGPFNGLISLTDDQGLVQEPEQSSANSFSPFILSSIPNILIPKYDIVKGTDTFRIPLSSNAASFSYLQSDMPFSSAPKVIIDLTKIMSPADEPPKSNWVLGSNIGYSAKIDPLVLTINDERYTQDNLQYILGVTFKNNGTYGLTPHANEINV